MISEFGACNCRKPTPEYDCMEIVRQTDRNCPGSIGSLWWSGVMEIHENQNAKDIYDKPADNRAGRSRLRNRKVIFAFLAVAQGFMQVQINLQRPPVFLLFCI